MADEKGNCSRSTTQWIAIINTILEKRPGFLRVEDTDHEYRTDSRNVTAIAGKNVHLPIDSLAYNVDKDWRHLKKLLECYDNIL
jgi:hypothetical protein